MPTSAYEGRSFFTNHLMDRVDEIRTIVDFGPGEGTYSTLGRHIIPSAEWVGVEVFEPYIERYDLLQKYDDVLIGNMKDIEIDQCDLAIFGDVLEHVTAQEAVDVLEYMATRARHIYVSCPIVPAPQGPSHGNDHEAHLHDWSFGHMTDLLRTLGDIDAWEGHVVGRWWVTTN